MTNISDSAQREAKMRAMKVAEFRMTDAAQTKECVDDLVRNAGLSVADARTVTAAFRAKTLPAVAREEGLTDGEIESLLRLSSFGPFETADFAKDKKTKDDDATEVSDDDITGTGDDTKSNPFGDDAGDSLSDGIGEHGDLSTGDEDATEGVTPDLHSTDVEPGTDNDDALSGAMAGGDDNSAMPFDDKSNGSSEALNDEGAGETTTFEIEVPVERAQEVHELLQKMLAGDDTDPSTFEAGETDFDAAPHTTEASTRKVRNSMNIQDELAQRKAERQAVLARVAGTRVASEENKPRDIGLGKDTTEGTYMGERATSISTNEAAQYNTQKSFPTMTLKNSEGNSLREQNPTFGKLDIPTMNPEHLALKDSYNATKKEGSPEDSADYVIAFGDVDWVPSSNPDREQPIAITTQMEQRDRNTVIAQIVGQDQTGARFAYPLDLEKAEDVLYNLLQGAGVKEDEIGRLNFAQGINLYHAIRVAGAPEVQVNVADKEENKEETGKFPEDFTRKPEKTDESGRKANENEIFQARLSTAWEINARLAKANLIDETEMSANVQKWMQSGMTVEAMMGMGHQMLRLASTAPERVAAALQDRTGVRTASISTNPVITTAPTVVPTAPSLGSASDFEQAVRSALRNDSFELYEEERAQRLPTRR